MASVATSRPVATSTTRPVMTARENVVKPSIDQIGAALARAAAADASTHTTPRATRLRLFISVPAAGELPVYPRTVPRNAEVIRQWTILREIERARGTGVTIDELAVMCGVTTRTVRR